VSGPSDEPLVPPSGGSPQQPATPPARVGHGHQPGDVAQSAYATSWPQQPVGSQPGWGAPESRALEEAEAALRKARTALGWAIGASVGALLALVAAFAVPRVIAASSVEYADAGYPVNGTVAAFRPGGKLSGVTVALAVENALYDDGSDVEGVNCPDTAAAQVSTVVACTGTFDGDDWTLIVYLLDEEGSILVTSY
jgi:hypothetical protein